MTRLYLPNGDPVTVPDDQVATVLAQSPDIKRLADWTSKIHEHHWDYYFNGSRTDGGSVPRIG